MLILALDTTTPRGSIALVDGSGSRQEALLPERAQVITHLPGDLDRLLTAAGVSLADVQAFAVAVGPGSFTGLRIGIATMQGLAVATGRPLVGVSALDALADAGRAGRDAAVVTWVDAWRGEVYAAYYAPGAAAAEPTVDRPAQLLEELARTATGETCFIGDGVEGQRDAILAARPDFHLAPESQPALAAGIGRLALARLRTGEPCPPGAIHPLYVRRPDVELKRSAERGRSSQS